MIILKLLGKPVLLELTQQGKKRMNNSISIKVIETLVQNSPTSKTQKVLERCSHKFSKTSTQVYSTFYRKLEMGNAFQCLLWYQLGIKTRHNWTKLDKNKRKNNCKSVLLMRKSVWGASTLL